MARRAKKKIQAWFAVLVAGFGAGLGTGLYLDEPAAVLPAWAPGPPPAAPPPPTRPVEVIAQSRFEVVRIVDGDTFVVWYDGEPTKVRILGIDTPERGDAGYDEATEALRGLIEGRAVTLHFDADSKRDGFGRLLARVTVEGRDVGEELLRRDLARRWQ